MKLNAPTTSTYKPTAEEFDPGPSTTMPKHNRGVTHLDQLI